MLCRCYSTGSGWHFCQIFRPGWYLVRLLVQADLWSDVPSRIGFGSGWHLVRLLVRLTSGQMHPSREASGQTFSEADLCSDVSQNEALGQVEIWSDIPPRQIHLVVTVILLWVRLTFDQMYPPRQRHLVAMCDTTSGQVDIWSPFSIAFLICDYKSSSLKVVSWCSDTSDWWWKDMSKLVWRENSQYSLSLHLVQEYVIRSCRYTTANSPWK